ncbi:LytR/AlgR family response regulator transcription factor [Aquimarina sp. 2201CG14-23]|uniref:LytR/AlgR family response regulator transcription factor n=1 Tax=Aquimarina mycalae TaxID=3040073 RepID=UPI002477CE29|nr:LytTR family DNA-binding domain-containing protein [Aquimarina sp. 2201CG14-23]MDH7445380.1 LytTR family DNA-binding domain-containing protein [Aquimarina sp. 2201CG14-23]
MIKAIVVDDEVYIRDNVKAKLTQYFSEDIEVVGEAESVEASIKIIEEKKPDLLFLDIHLTDGTSFDLLAKIKDKNFDIIFVTAFDEHALKAIKVGALDYILKPIENSEFKEAVIKAIENSKKEHDLEKLVEISSEYFQGAQKKRIILKTLENVYVVYEDDILYCKSEGNYTTFYTKKDKNIVVSKPIKKVIELLSEDIFIRCHQSYLVNKTHVSRYNKQGVLIIDPDIKVPVSSRRKDYVIEKIF